MSDLIRARHTVSGKIAEVTPDIFNHEILGAYLEEVGPDAKPYLPEMHRVSLPANPTADQVAVAIQAGVITEEEAKDIKIQKDAKPEKGEVIFEGPDHSDEPADPEFKIVGYIDAPQTEDED